MSVCHQRNSRRMKKLIQQAQAGDMEALEALWEQTRRFAFTVSRRFLPTSYADADDLQQCAYLGFHTAVMRHTGRYDFLAFVRWCTQRECQKALDLYGSRRQIRAESLDIVLSDGEHTPADLIMDESLPESSAGIEANELVRDVRAAVAELPERERTLIENRWLGTELLSLDQTGTIMGISRERVRQIEQRAFERLRRDPVLQTYSSRYVPSSPRSGLSRFLNTRTSCVEQEALCRIQHAEAKQKQQSQKHGYAGLLESLAAEGFLDPGELETLLPMCRG